MNTSEGTNTPITPVAKTVEQPAFPQIRTLEDDLARAQGSSPTSHNLTNAPINQNPTPAQAPNNQAPLNEALKSTVAQASAEQDAQRKAKQERLKKNKKPAPKAPTKTGYRPYTTKLDGYVAPKPPRDLEELHAQGYGGKPKEKKKGGFLKLFSFGKKKEEPETILNILLSNAPSQQVKEQTATVRTYSDDLNDAVKEKKASVVSIALAEEKRRARDERKRPTPQSPGRIRNILFVLSSIVLILAGGWLGVSSYVTYTERVQVPVRVPSKALFNTEHEHIIPRTEFSPSVAQELIYNLSETADTVTYIKITETETLETGETITTTLGGQELAQVLIPKIPKGLLRNIPQNGAMYGIYHGDRNEPFIILTADSFELMLSEMLAWEPTLYEDTKGALRTLDPYIKIKVETDSETGQEMNIEEIIPVETTSFKDALLKNRDVRVVREPIVSEMVFLYGFVDTETVIITTDSRAFTEISERLNRAKSSK